MPIIINGASRRAGAWWANHLTNKERNERVELIEMRGVAAETVSGAFKEMEALAIGTKCDNYFYQANINPRADEHLTPEQWVEAVDTLERNLGLSGQPRFVIEHEKDGRTHRHVVWSRVDVEHQRAISDSFTAPIHERTSRELESAFGLEPGRSILVADRDFERPERGPEKWERFRGERHGIDPEQITAELTGLWQNSDSGQSFKSAIEERGYILAQGDRRDLVVLDQAGDVHSLARRLEGVRAKDVLERFADLDGSDLPTVTEAKALIAERRQTENYFDRDAADARWQSAVDDAGIAHDAAKAAEISDTQPEQREQGTDAGRSIDRDLSPETDDGRTADGQSGAIERGGNPVRGIAMVLDGAAKIAESVLGLFDNLTGGSPKPEHQPEPLQPPPPAPALLPAESPRAAAHLDLETRREAVLRAIGEAERTLRQDGELRERQGLRPLTVPGPGRGQEIERDRS